MIRIGGRGSVFRSSENQERIIRETFFILKGASATERAMASVRGGYYKGEDKGFCVKRGFHYLEYVLGSLICSVFCIRCIGTFFSRLTCVD
jgi:hypothetical protein